MAAAFFAGTALVTASVVLYKQDSERARDLDRRRSTYRGIKIAQIPTVANSYGSSISVGSRVTLNLQPEFAPVVSYKASPPTTSECLDSFEAISVCL